jgi:hypothetical protein
MHPDTEVRETFARSDDKPLEAPVEYVITVYNGRWIFSLAPQNGWVTTSDHVETFAYSLAVALIVTLLQYFGVRATFFGRDNE